MPEFNIPLARKVWEHLIAHPEEHDQDNFGVQTTCGTTCCVAGTALMMSPEAQFRFNSAGFMIGADIHTPEDLDDQAQKLLGLTDEQKYELFFGFDNAKAVELLGQYIEDAEASDG